MVAAGWTEAQKRAYVLADSGKGRIADAISRPRRLAKLIGRDGGELAYLAISDGAEAAAQEGRTDPLVYDGDGPDGIGRQRARRCHAVPRYVSADHEHVPAQLSAGSNGSRAEIA